MFYLLHGPDEFTMRQELARLRDTGDFEFSVDVFAGAEADLASILNTCDTLPFLSTRRLVVVDGLPKRKRAAKAADDEDNGAVQPAPADAPPPKAPARGKKGRATGPDPKAFAQGLAEHVPRLPETTVLVVLVDELLDAGNPLLAAAQRHGKVRAFTPPRGPQLDAWLARQAQAQGVRLTPEAAQLLLRNAGDNLRTLSNEVAKLATYAGAGGEVGAAEVRLLTPNMQQARIFDLTDALARRDRKRALALLHELLAAGESPLGIVALTAHQTRSLLQVKALHERGLRPAQIAQTAGMAPFVVEKSLPLSRQFSVAQLESAHRALLRVDAALKSSKMTPEMALDLLVIEFGT